MLEPEAGCAKTTNKFKDRELCLRSKYEILGISFLFDPLTRMYYSLHANVIRNVIGST